jgi:prepilin-type N-terminal cleavage/methylation domain-containing protein
MQERNGFSLVEIMVSSVIFALVILGLISVFVSASKQITHTRERMTSAQLGKFFLDPLQDYVRDNDWDSGNELSANGDNKPGGSQVINNRTFTETHDVSAVGGTGLRRVTSKISWDE